MSHPLNLPEATSATCQHCGAALVPDQRYCLTCGHPCSPVRLAFLDVLQGERASYAPAPIGPPQGGYATAWEHAGPAGSLQRHAGLFGLITVLLVDVSASDAVFRQRARAAWVRDA